MVSSAWDWLARVNLEVWDVSPFFNELIVCLVFAWNNTFVDKVSNAEDELLEFFENWLFLGFGLLDFFFDLLDLGNFFLETKG